MGPGEGSDLSFVLLAFPSCFLMLFETKGEYERKIALLEGRKLREGICPHATENPTVCIEKSNTHPPSTCLHKFTLKCVSTYYKSKCPEMEGKLGGGGIPGVLGVEPRGFWEKVRLG